MSKPIRVAILAVVALALVGCAQTSQQVRLAPKADVPQSDIGGDRPVALRVVDERDDPVLGWLENRGADDGEVTSDTELHRVLRASLEEALEDNGFRPTDWRDDAERRLTITIVAVDHHVGARTPHDVETRVELRSEGHRNGNRLTGRTRTSETDRVSRRPNADANAAYLDAVLGRALTRVLSEEMLRFLAAED